jgi:hypothetical protein
MTVVTLLLGASAIVLLGRDSWLQREAIRMAAEIPQVTALESGMNPDGAFVLMFREEDCPSIAGAILRLNALAQADERAVLGLVVSGAGADPLSLSREFGIEFPVRSVSGMAAAVLAQSMGFRSTPILLVVNPSGQVVASGPSRDGREVDSVVRRSGVGTE